MSIPSIDLGDLESCLPDIAVAQSQVSSESDHLVVIDQYDERNQRQEPNLFLLCGRAEGWRWDGVETGWNMTRIAVRGVAVLA